MVRTVTTNAINRIMGKRLTGREAAKLLLQDSIDLSCGLPTVLTDVDVAGIRSAPLGGRDIRAFNNIMGLARAFETSMAMCETAWRDSTAHSMMESWRMVVSSSGKRGTRRSH